MKITSVQRQKKNKDRFSVYVDEEYAFSINEDDYLRLGLYEEREITGEEIENIKTSVNFNSAKADAIKYVALRVRSQKEVVEKLDGLGYDSSIILKVIDELKSIGYIDDRMYARKYISERNKLKPKSKRMLRFELMRKGIDEDIIDGIIGELTVDDESTAYRVSKQKFGKYDLKKPETQKKLRTFLFRRGYGEEIIKSTISSLLEEK